MVNSQLNSKFLDFMCISDSYANFRTEFLLLNESILFQGDSFISIVERKIPKSSKVAAFSRKSGTIIVVAINSTTSTKWSRKNVFIFHNTEKLEPIQIVNTPLITDIAIW